MKPLYIRMQAFGSYQEAEIDFTSVQNGLFLITGDTGAGKTTIFDAITFALFDETSGGKRSGEMMRSQYARQDLITEVEFRFQYYNQVYTIIRRPKQDKFKAKTLEDGNVVYEKNKTPLGPDVELILPDGSSYPGKKTETDKKIREIIGLDAAQFTQIAM
ncbi:MAG: AAA family ATPase, partial [Peptococcaceae bacterium]|nr:AAA family ATPase [Peptococcaceae bacterium]